MHSLNRFHLAHEDGSAGYLVALKELKSGRKQSQWIWFIFPQLKGSGESVASEFYGLNDFKETCSYLHDPLLRERYDDASVLVAGRLERHLSLEKMMGSPGDAQKVISSATLFRAAAEFSGLKETAKLCDSLLKAASRQGYVPCRMTLHKLSFEISS